MFSYARMIVIVTVSLFFIGCGNGLVNLDNSASYSKASHAGALAVQRNPGINLSGMASCISGDKLRRCNYYKNQGECHPGCTVAQPIADLPWCPYQPTLLPYGPASNFCACGNGRCDDAGWGESRWNCPNDCV